LNTLRTPLGRTDSAPENGAKNGMPDSITWGSMASTIGVPMQLKSAKLLRSSMKPLTLTSARLTS